MLTGKSAALLNVRGIVTSKPPDPNRPSGPTLLWLSNPKGKGNPPLVPDVAADTRADILVAAFYCVERIQRGAIPSVNGDSVRRLKVPSAGLMANPEMFDVPGLAT